MPSVQEKALVFSGAFVSRLVFLVIASSKPTDLSQLPRLDFPFCELSVITYSLLEAVGVFAHETRRLYHCLVSSNGPYVLNFFSFLRTH